MWRPIKREQVAWICEKHGESIDYNPAARAAFIWAAKVIREGGQPDETVLTPDEYLKADSY